MSTDKIICRCEEITEQEIRSAVQEGYVTVRAVKRRTRAGMGFCQGRTCGPLIRDIIRQMTGMPAESILPDTARFPVFAIKLGQLAELQIDEDQ